MKKKATSDEPIARWEWIVCTVIGGWSVIASIIWCSILLRRASRKIEKNTFLLGSGVVFTFVSLFLTVYILMGSMLMVANGEEGTFGLCWYFFYKVPFGLFEIAAYFILEARNRKLRKIMALIQTEHITSVPLIGEIIGKSTSQTAVLLRKMLRMGVLDGAYLEEDDGELQFTKSVWAKQLVECVHCGAKHTVNLGQTLVCAYCGSALQVKRAYTESV